MSTCLGFEAISRSIARRLAVLLVVAAAAALLAVPSSPRADVRREVIRLSASERAEIRQGMQAYLASIQAIVEALAQNRLRAVAAAAKKSGNAMLQQVPITLTLKLPPAFTVMAADTHQRFEELAKTAEAGSRTTALKQLGDILDNCNGCHAFYRLGAE